MNIDNILELADVLENVPEEKFDMNSYTHGCGGPACVAGWAVFHFYGLEALQKIGKHYKAKNSLGLDEKQSLLLFELIEWTHNIRYNGIRKATPQDAAKVLRLLAKTGTVRWDKVVG